MAEQQLEIEVPGSHAITAIRTAPEGRSAGWTLIYAPGAGSNVHDPFGAYACRALAARGFESVRFQFPYMETKRRSPDRTPVLEATWRAVLESLGGRRRSLVGGRSMGGRIGSHVIAQGTPADALVLFAYPLHPPGKPEQRRDAHLPHIEVPVLFCSGTRDAFATPEELAEAASTMSRASVHLLEAADHGFAAPKSSGRTRQQIWEEAVVALLEWLREV
ncbi:MAG TPA: alpha/beta family hydrolase [Candidatus Krumholzibacteria bacterium]